MGISAQIHIAGSKNFEINLSGNETVKEILVKIEQHSDFPDKNSSQVNRNLFYSGGYDFVLDENYTLADKFKVIIDKEGASYKNNMVIDVDVDVVSKNSTSNLRVVN